ncbi:hypothetical protein FRC03_010482 [Tulasnella sp. 419]|nr:hypothetical protein FRC03_010482 [Tulasnella sp. 419]
MLLSQIARYRTALDSLREADPKLEEEFKGVSLQLEASALLPSTVGRSSNMTAELEAFKYWKIAEQWRNCITKIQQLEGFEDFLKPPKYPTLQQAAVNGPVVIVNLGLNRSHALIMQKIGDPITLELVDARPEVFDGHVTAFLDAVHLTEKTESEEARGIKMLTQILSQLWRTVASPVVEQLQIIGWQRLSRIWWCPTSSLALLPLHAAGPHDGRQENLPDIYISSYTSTISALMKSLARSPVQPDPEDTPKLLFVAQPGIKGLSRYLPSVMEELKGVVEVIGEKSVTQLVNKKSDVVLAEMQRHRWVHFACHGSQAQDAPFDSSLELNDKYLTLLDIIQARLPDAQLAFLAICQSAKGDQTRPDETLHLGSGLQFVGFRSVIGTMYSMDDQDGPFLAKEVYGYMLKHEHNDYSDAAKALHNAVKNLKKKGVAVYRWINYVHIGA